MTWFIGRLERFLTWLDVRAAELEERKWAKFRCSVDQSKREARKMRLLMHVRAKRRENTDIPFSMKGCGR